MRTRNAESPKSVWVVPDGAGSRIAVTAVPRASKSGVAGEYGGTLRIRLAAPPADGRANKELLSFLSDALGVPTSSLRLAAGASSRRKSVTVAGLSPAACAARLLPTPSPAP